MLLVSSISFDNSSSWQFVLPATVDFRLKEIVNFAFTAIEGFSTDNIPWCVGESVFYCRFQYMLDSVDLRYPYNR